jgi:hypothetical protein
VSPQFVVRFYRVGENVMRQRNGIIGGAEDIEPACTLDQARKFGRAFITSHPTLGCAVYSAGDRLIETITLPVKLRACSRSRSAVEGALLLILAIAGVWWDATTGFVLLLPTLIAVRILYLALIRLAEIVFGSRVDSDRE